MAARRVSTDKFVDKQTGVRVPTNGLPVMLRLAEVSAVDTSGSPAKVDIIFPGETEVHEDVIMVGWANGLSDLPSAGDWIYVLKPEGAPPLALGLASVTGGGGGGGGD